MIFLDRIHKQLASQAPWLLHSSYLSRLLRFSIVGGIATLVQYLILIALVMASDFSPAIASTIGFVISSLVNYILNYSFTFKSSKPHTETLTRFLIISVCGLIINYLFMQIGTRAFNLHYLFVQLAATAATLLWNFSLNHLWSFRTTSEGPYTQHKRGEKQWK